ncbi:MAG: T9SS type A sorting domain-containing protein [Bacteroidota bacterium]
MATFIQAKLMRFGIHILFFICLISNGMFSQSRIQQLQATQYKQSVLINYVITQGNSCSGYQIQRSTDSVNFETIYDYSGVCGELTKSQEISFTDEHPYKNSVNYYRVLIPPADHSKITSVLYSPISEKGYVLYDNPVSDYLILRSITKSKLKIYNQTGHLVREIISSEDASYKEDVSFLDNGLYYFLIVPATGQSVFGKFIKK